MVTPLKTLMGFSVHLNVQLKFYNLPTIKFWLLTQKQNYQQYQAQLNDLTKDMNPDKPIFLQKDKRIYVSTVNNHLTKYCERAGVDVISVHGLRHTHASLLIYDGVSIPSVAKRLGHANTITTQQTYLHIVKELEARDNQKILENMIRLS